MDRAAAGMCNDCMSLLFSQLSSRKWPEQLSCTGVDGMTLADGQHQGSRLGGQNFLESKPRA